MKIVKVFSMLACMVMLLATGCAGTETTAEKVAAKIEKGEALTQDDYGVIIDYCGKYAEAAQQIQNQINAIPNMSQEATVDTDKMAELTNSYKFLNVFSPILTAATQDQVGPEGVKKINGFVQYEWFPAPEWAVPTGDNAVGEIVNTQNDTGNVVATGDGEAVD